jgi:hypothetical protein
MTRINRRQFPSLSLVFLLFTFPAFAASAPGHGLWVWKTSTVLDAPHAAAKLRDFCKAQDINEVYVSVSAKDGTSEDGHLTELIAHLHHATIRVEALLSSTDADEAGKPREKHDRADEVMSSFATTAFPQRQFLLGLKAREGTAIVKQSATRNRFSKMRFPDTGIWPCRMAFADN